MGKPTGFKEFARELPVDRQPKERLKDWQEFHEHFDEKKLRDQGARCMDCGVPFCHTGTLLSGMASGCPINNLIPEWNDLIFRGLWKEALERLASSSFDGILVSGRLEWPGRGRAVVAIVAERPELQGRALVALPEPTAAEVDRLQRLGIRTVALPFDLRELRTAVTELRK